MSDKSVRIAIDAMGGDHAPHITVEGTCIMSLESPAELILIGDEPVISAELKKHRHDPERIRIVHTPVAITMEDSPKVALKEKSNASVVLAAKLLSAGEADAMVSAGSTGAVVISAAMHIKRIAGVRRTAIAILYPTLNAQKRNDIFSMMLDIGANVSNQPDDLVHYAYMGSSYKEKVLKVKSPTVALLNIGAESHKGNETMKTAYQLLSACKDLNFIGNIEGNELMSGKADVIVTEGMTGNIAMKTMEGTSEAVKKIGGMAKNGKLIWKLGLLCLSGGIKKLMKVASYEEYGGAPLLGYEKIVIKAHGRSSAYAFKNGIRAAIRAVEDDVIGIMQHSIAHYESEKNPSDK